MEEIIQKPGVHTFIFGHYSGEQIFFINETIRYLEALVNQDIDYLKDHIDPQAEFEMPSKGFQRYMQEVEELEQKKHRYDSVTIQAPMVHLLKDQAIVSVTALFKGVWNGKKGIHPRQLTLHFKNKSGLWKIV